MDKVPMPVIKRKKVRTFDPKCLEEIKTKAKEFGYNERYSEILGQSQELVRERLKPIEYDTNETRRTMIKPTEKGTYK